MTIKNFQYAITTLEEYKQDPIDIEDVVAVKYIDSLEVVSQRLPNTFKRKEILPYLENTFILFYDKFGNAYSRIIY